jgi:hypothetical protein
MTNRQELIAQTISLMLHYLESLNADANADTDHKFEVIGIIEKLKSWQQFSFPD